MRENKVRRLPVVAADGKLEGIQSMNDVVLKAEEASDNKAPELSYGEVVNTTSRFASTVFQCSRRKRRPPSDLVQE